MRFSVLDRTINPGKLLLLLRTFSERSTVTSIPPQPPATNTQTLDLVDRTDWLRLRCHLNLNSRITSQRYDVPPFFTYTCALPDGFLIHLRDQSNDVQRWRLQFRSRQMPVCFTAWYTIQL